MFHSVNITLTAFYIHITGPTSNNSKLLKAGFMFLVFSLLEIESIHKCSLTELYPSPTRHVLMSALSLMSTFSYTLSVQSNNQSCNLISNGVSELENGSVVERLLLLQRIQYFTPRPHASGSQPQLQEIGHPFILLWHPLSHRHIHMIKRRRQGLVRKLRLPSKHLAIPLSLFSKWEDFKCEAKYLGSSVLFTYFCVSKENLIHIST